MPKALVTKLAGSVFVQAGRRVDAPNAEVSRFPPGNIQIVRARIKAAFLENQPVAIVSSAACGTDLLALDIGSQLNVERFIVLPSGPTAFRSSSVTDRPGNWGTLFDEVTSDAHLEILTVSTDEEGFRKTNLKLLDKAQELGMKHAADAIAMVVWDERSRGGDDVTEQLLTQARQPALPIIEISTL